MMAVMWRRMVVVLIPNRWAMASSCSPWAINSSTACCAGVRRSPATAERDALSGVARSHSSSKYSRSAAMMTGARTTKAPAPLPIR
jgi:hypothetical protein